MTDSIPNGGGGANQDVLGVVLAGGESRRFGGEKALFPLLGRAMAGWALGALEPWTAAQVVITNDLTVADSLGVPGRPDRIPGLGPLGGLLTALTWAQEEGREKVFLLACDLPLVTEVLVGSILHQWPEESGAVVPGSHGPLGFEPLCAGCAVRGLRDVEDVIDAGGRTMKSALDRVGVFRIPPSDLGSPEDLSVAFSNVNTRDMARWAESALSLRLPPSEGNRWKRKVDPPSEGNRWSRKVDP